MTALFVISEAVAYDWLPEPWNKYGTAVVTVAAYAGVYATRNASSAAPGAVLTPVPGFPGSQPALVDIEALRRTLANVEQVRDALEHPAGPDYPMAPRPDVPPNPGFPQS